MGNFSQKVNFYGNFPTKEIIVEIFQQRNVFRILTHIKLLWKFVKKAIVCENSLTKRIFVESFQSKRVFVDIFKKKKRKFCRHLKKGQIL